MIAKKSLRLTIEGAKLDWDFSGPWTGKDAVLVAKKIFREYKLYQRMKRRKNLRAKPNSQLNSTVLPMQNIPVSGSVETDSVDTISESVETDNANTNLEA